jgi:hypothetical protein
MNFDHGMNAGRVKNVGSGQSGRRHVPLKAAPARGRSKYQTARAGAFALKGANLCARYIGSSNAGIYAKANALSHQGATQNG